ncbi:hypothetical protein [Streptomyces sp. AD55]|uniref:hypothetical protein n=1 Tax=Streptomyces sp. AD55 TaxID=3242895 RepID=UPI003528AC78
MSAAVEGIAHVGRSRIEGSGDPTRFQDLLVHFVTRVTGGRNVEAPARLVEDDVLTAAYIEALAGIRRLRAAEHPGGCCCDACRTYLFVTTGRRYDR